MYKIHINAIAAIGQNRELGKNNDLIWKISDDLKRFKELTMGQSIIMGRKTYESIGRPLPNRLNIVVTRNNEYAVPGAIVTHSLEEALQVAEDNGRESVFIIGGAQLYTEALPLIEKLYLTHIKATDPEADTFFPEYAKDFAAVETQPEMEAKDLIFQWVDYRRK